MKIKIGTRGSKLALIQTETVCDKLRQAYPEHTFEIEIISTKGDVVQNRPLHEIGGSGLFVREIEQKLLQDEIQLGVHSMKDMPAVLPEGLVFAKAWPREDPRDALILRETPSLQELPQGAVIGTGSKRRAFQLLALRPDLRIVNLRGNVDTRLRKMEEQKLDGIVLAAAGLHRLGLQQRITQYLEPAQMIPSPTQGFLALECRRENTGLLQMLQAFSEENAETTAQAERAFLREIGADCHMPVGALCTPQNGAFRLDALYGREDGSRLARASVTGSDPQRLAAQAARRIRSQLAGTVCLVSGGPGDSELVTVKGLRQIREADCILYDRLSPAELPTLAKPQCEKIFVGKQNAHPSMRQDAINRLLIAKAMQYDKVVRLKGGDAYVFGRGGEEALALREAGVPFSVIPGVSSATAGLACAGIPITHRGIASGFHVLTAHGQTDALADIDFDALAKSRETCVFLMGLSKVGEITQRLLQAGMDGQTDAAVISCAATPRQRVCTADLQHLAKAVEAACLPSPALIVVGGVVRLRDKLNFFEKQPLFGKRCLVPKIGTRPAPLAQKLRACGAEVQEVTVGEIVQIPAALSAEKLQAVRWILFTSRNGIDAFFASLQAAGLDSRSLANTKIAVIGHSTGRHLRQYGLHPDLTAETANSSSLCQTLGRVLSLSDTVWYPKAAQAGHSIRDVLAAFCHFEELPIYENRPVPPKEFDPTFAASCEAVFFTCASSAKRVLQALGHVPAAWGTQTTVVSIGPKCSAALRQCGVASIVEADSASPDAMVKALLAQQKLQ